MDHSREAVISSIHSLRPRAANKSFSELRHMADLVDFLQTRPAISPLHSHRPRASYESSLRQYRSDLMELRGTLQFRSDFAARLAELVAYTFAMI